MQFFLFQGKHLIYQAISPGPTINLFDLTIESSSSSTVPNMKQIFKEWAGWDGIGREDPHNNVDTLGWPQSTSDMRTPCCRLIHVSLNSYVENPSLQ